MPRPQSAQADFPRFQRRVSTRRRALSQRCRGAGRPAPRSEQVAEQRADLRGGVREADFGPSLPRFQSPRHRPVRPAPV